MTLVSLGGISVGGAAPGADIAVTAGIAGINAGLTNLLDQLAALTAYVPQPIDFAAQLSVAQQTVAGISAAIALGITPPTLDTQIAVIAAQIAALQATVDSINAQLSILTDLQGPLAAAGVFGYAYDGAVNAFGGELGSALAGGIGGGAPTDHANAVVYITTIPATWAAMGEVFKVSP